MSLTSRTWFTRLICYLFHLLQWWPSNSRACSHSSRCPPAGWRGAPSASGRATPSPSRFAASTRYFTRMQAICTYNLYRVFLVHHLSVSDYFTDRLVQCCAVCTSFRGANAVQSSYGIVSQFHTVNVSLTSPLPSGSLSCASCTTVAKTSDPCAFPSWFTIRPRYDDRFSLMLPLLNHIHVIHVRHVFLNLCVVTFLITYD